MKRSSLPTAILLLLTSVFFLASASQGVANSAPEAGRLVITRSPTLGRNVTITLKIDGKLVGSLGWGRTYDQPIASGRHVLAASATRTSGAWQATLDVHAGQTYSYSASYSVDKLVLTRTSR
jgi:hypothetical protein